MTIPSDIAGLSERLRHLSAVMVSSREKIIAMSIWEDDPKTLDEAATALDSLSARVKELEAERDCHQQMSDKNYKLWAEERERALRAEQQRDEAYERAAELADCYADHCDAVAITSGVEEQVSALRSKEQAANYIAAAIRRLASGPEGGSEGEK